MTYFSVPQSFKLHQAASSSQNRVFTTRRLGVALCLGLASLVTTSCSRDIRPENTLQLASKLDASTLDPAKAYDTSAIQYVRLIYRGLVEYDNKANLVNEVAQSRTVSPDGLTYTFKLRSDVYFVNNKLQKVRRVEAEDFRFALERVLDPVTASDGESQYDMIDGADEYTAAKKAKKGQEVPHVRGIEVLGNDIIRFRLKRADATFLNYLAVPFAYAVPREYVRDIEKRGLSLSENPLGCGPFVLEEWVHDGWLSMRRNPHYFHHDLPRVERIQTQMGISPTLQTMLFEQGRADLLALSDVSAPEYLRLSHDTKWKQVMLHAPMMDLRYMCMNTELKPFNDVRVRRAMNYAIDRDKIVSFLSGRATKARGVLPPGMPAFDSHLPYYEYNPSKARKLLKDAGYGNGFPRELTLWYSDAEPWTSKAVQTIQENLRQVGITINTKTLTYGDLKAKAGQRRNIELSMLGWLQDFTDPSNFLDNLFNSRSISDVASKNRSFYSNPKVDKLLDDALVETNRTRRLAMYREAERIVHDDAPVVFLHHTERYALHQPWIEGYTLHPMWSQRYEYVRVNDAKRLHN